MFCDFCGCEISDRAKVCYHCGKKTDKSKRNSAKQAKAKNKNSIAISGFVISLINLILGLVINLIVFNQIDSVSYVIIICVCIMLIAIVGLILCFIGYKKSNVYELANLAVAGIILSIIVIIVTAIFLALVMKFII